MLNFCRSNERRFGGGILCRACKSSSVTDVASVGPSATSDQCGSPVDAKVVAFCRLNSRRFAKQTLFRSCQVGLIVEIISGGQTGADRAGLDVASAIFFRTPSEESGEVVKIANSCSLPCHRSLNA